MFRRYQDTSCRTNCECEFGFLAGRISAIRFQSPVLLDLQGEGRLISCARKKKIEHVALSRLPGRWGSLDFNKKVLLFLLRLLLRIRAASPRFLPPTCRHHGHQYSPRPRSKCQLKWRNTRARRLYLQLSGAHAPEHSCEHSTGCGHMRIRTLSRAPGHAGHIWTRTCTRKKARIDAK